MRAAVLTPLLLTLTLAAACGPALAAESLALSGLMGNKALLVIDGQPQMLAVGASARGVKLLRLDGDEAQVERGGVVSRLRVGAAPVAVGGKPGPSSSGQIVLTAGPGGHFTSNGTINGRSVNFLVDTGATVVGIGLDDARRLGLDLSRGERVAVGTANGTVQAVRVTLTSVRLGDVEVFNVPALVTQASMPHVLLGNSFLSRFQMRRDNDVLRLEAKP